MSQLAIIKLVKTLSKSEKRFFKLQSKKQSGNKDYLKLFDLIDNLETADVKHLREKFCQLHPGSSLDHAQQYLMKVLTDCLIQSKMEKDIFFQSIQTILRARILQERSLPEESYKQLKKARQQSIKFQKHSIEYLTYRYELDYFSNSSFRGISDEMLIQTQMKAKDVLKNLNHVQDHSSLFEILKYRLINSGKVSSDEGKKRLNDLILSEMVLVAGKGKNSFSSRKLHLLFQSYFFINIGDYQSALKTFGELNHLFEQNQELFDHPPLDYLSSLTGMLDSLLMLGNHQAVLTYIDKLTQLDQPDYPEHFCFHVRKTVAVFQLAVLCRENKVTEAISLIDRFEPGLLRAYNLVNEEKQWELYFYCSLVYFKKHDWKRAHAFISEAIRENSLHAQLIVCKAIRLLDLLIYYEKGDNDYIAYEVRSYRRFFRQQGPMLQIEQLVLKIIVDLSDPNKRSKIITGQNKIIKKFNELSEDKYEKQLIKYLDLTDWIKRRTIR